MTEFELEHARRSDRRIQHRSDAVRSPAALYRAARRMVTAAIMRVALLPVLIALMTVSPAAFAQSDKALDIKDRIWGFDGRVQPGHFNPVSLLVDNISDEPVEAMATFAETQGVLFDSTGKQVQSVYIAPHSRKWVQFYPYIGNMYQTEWRLKIGRQSFDSLTQPRAALKTDLASDEQRPQAVIFDRPDYNSNQPTTIKHFPEHIFPPYSTVTFGLHTVFMDHAPDWELPREQAFIAWLKMGGRLHILKDQRGGYPEFSGELAELSQPFDRFRVGSGLVVRHDIQRSELTADVVSEALGTETHQTEEQALEDSIQQAEQQQLQYGTTYDTMTTPGYQDDEIFKAMRQMTQPDHAWWLIFLLAITYIGMIFPGCWILSQKKQVHFLATYGAIAGLSVVFSILFLLIGRRGYGESTTLHSLAVARMEDDTHASLFQWNALFVTDGDTYAAGAPDQQSVFATASGETNVNAATVAGNSGGIEIQIPPYSAQTFVSRRRVTLPDLQFRIAGAELNSAGLKSLTVSTGDRFDPPEGTVFRAIAGSRIYRLAFDPETRLITQAGAISRLGQFTRGEFDQQFGFSLFGSQTDVNDDRTLEQRFYDDALPRIVRRALLDDLVYDPAKFTLPTDRVRLLIYTTMPDELHVPIDVESRRTGRVLIVQDLFVNTGG